jgi:hypothetical protein
MDNEIVTIKYDDGTKIIFKFLFKKSFSWKMLNDSRNIVYLLYEKMWSLENK